MKKNGLTLDFRVWCALGVSLVNPKTYTGTKPLVIHNERLTADEERPQKGHQFVVCNVRQFSTI